MSVFNLQAEYEPQGDQPAAIAALVDGLSAEERHQVLLGVTVFMIGMLGVTALNISSLKSSTFAGNMSEAVIIAGDKIEELMAIEFDDPCILDPTCPPDPDYPLNDKDNDGTAQDPTNVGIDTVGGGNFGGAQPSNAEETTTGESLDDVSTIIQFDLFSGYRSRPLKIQQ